MRSFGAVFGLIYILLLFHYVSPKSYTFKSSPEEESKWSRFKGKVVPRVMKISKYFTAPPQIDVNSSDPEQSVLRVIPEEVHFDPCATSDQLCLNGGECRNDKGKFYCDCPDTHYGRRCELIADKKACVSHLCANGGVCYTTPNMQKVVNRSKLMSIDAEMRDYADCRKSSNSGDECERHKLKGAAPTKKSFEDVAQNVAYRCQCPLDFQGPLCDYTKEERLCDEDFCMGHGFAVLSPNKECSCACEPDYTGQHCESLLPCSAFVCHNEGICVDEFDADAGTYTAKCVCPDMKDQLVKESMKVEGEHCEIISLINEFNDIDPCGLTQNFEAKMEIFAQRHDAEYKAFVRKYSKVVADPTPLIDDVRRALYGSNTFRITKPACDHGTCSVVTGTVGPIGVLLPLPRCVCPPLHFGKYCHEVLESLCDITEEERKKGVTLASRCTSFDQGTCTVNMNDERVCECTDDYVGARCEIFAPCARNPCGNNADCIPIPFEKSSQDEQSYRCICDLGDEQNGNECVYHGEGNCAGNQNPCFHGRCVSCPVTTGNETSICDEEEQKRGLRCICAPGFAPPFCDRQLGPCETALCENNAVCKVNEQHTYECICAPGTSGEYCETVEDYCEFEGNRRCSNTGTCSNSNLTIRGFECSCEWEYRGADCEIHVGSMQGFLQIFHDYYMVSYPLSVLFFCIFFIIIADALCGRDGLNIRRKKKKIKMAAPSSSGGGSKTSKSSKKAKNESQTPPANEHNDVAVIPMTPVHGIPKVVDVTPLETPVSPTSPVPIEGAR